MISALGSHRFNPQTGLWELVSLENVAGVGAILGAVSSASVLQAPNVVADPIVAKPPEPAPWNYTPPTAPEWNYTPPMAPEWNYTPPTAPEWNYTPPTVPVLNYTPPTAPVLNYTPPTVPVLNYTPPTAPELNYTPPTVPVLNYIPPTANYTQPDDEPPAPSDDPVIVLPVEPLAPEPFGFKPPEIGLCILEYWVNRRTGERFVAPTTGWTHDDPDWTSDGHVDPDWTSDLQLTRRDPFLEPQQWVTAAIEPPVEPEGPDVFVAPETIPELVEVEEPADILIGPWGLVPWGWAPPIPSIPPTIIEKPDGLIIIGGNIHSVLEGGDGNDLIIAGASADHPGNWYTIGWCGSAPYYRRGDSLVGGLGQDTLVGNDLNNRLEGGAGADVMIGGGGDDFYVVNDAGDRVIEVDHGGYDWVRSSVSYILTDNVEGLMLAEGAGDINGAGNNLDNVLQGNEGRNILSGGAGNDWLHGGNGDTFIGGEGRDTFLLSYDDFINYPAGGANAIIADFQVGVDKIGYQYEYRLTLIEDTFLDVDHIVGSPSMRQDGADTIVTWGQGEIRLIGVDMRLLGEQDFFVDVTYPVYFY